MTTDVEPRYTHTRINNIYDLNPLWNAHSVPISFFSCIFLVFKPRNINESKLKPWKREKEFVWSHFQYTARKPFIDILKPLPPVDDQHKKGGRQSSEKLTLLKNNVTSSIVHMLDQVIDIILEVDNLNTELLRSKFAFGIFFDLRNPKNKNKTGTVSRFHNFNCYQHR
jgi:hypothetical protein